MFGYVNLSLYRNGLTPDESIIQVLNDGLGVAMNTFDSFDGGESINIGSGMCRVRVSGHDR